MEIEFDPDKNAVNRRKHRIDLADAAGFEFETSVVDEDDRRDYGEARFQALGVDRCASAHAGVHLSRSERPRDQSAQSEQKRVCVL